MRKLLAASLVVLMTAGLSMAVAEAQETPKRILVFGDSNSWGWEPVPEIAPIKRYPQDVAWPGVMQAELGDGYEVINESLSARTAASDDLSLGLSGAGLNGSQYLPAAIASHMPLDLVIIMLGTNDTKPVFGKSVLDISLDILSLASEVKRNTGVATSYSPAKVLLVVPPPLGDIADVDWVQAMFPQDAVTKSEELAGVLCDLAGAVELPCFDAGMVAQVTGADGIHMTADNHAKLGAAMAQQVKVILPSP